MFADMAWSGVMPVSWELQSLSSGGQGLLLVLCLLTALPWWEPEAVVGLGIDPMVNKLVQPPDLEVGVGDRDLASGVPVGRRGGIRRGPTEGSASSGKDRVAAPWGSYTAAETSCCDLRPTRRPPQTPVQPVRSCVFNLFWWRPYFLDAAVPTYLRASGVVPCAEVDRRVLRQLSAGGDEEGEGPDGVLANLCRVLFAIVLDQVASSFPLKVLFVKYNITAYEYSSL